ncbi:glycerophosphodiester phosphodiesterase, periplasmic [Abditibacteriota bacterium]|nr:glycerophosphodiester phosphodiesterase, periplasmic [Abditibacteriota bacterium]
MRNSQRCNQRGALKILLPLALLALCRESQALQIIAHRGAQARKPENTLASELLAQQMGADWLETDLIATKDHQLILSHDVFLERTTNIAQVFPTRKRQDGHYYALDFSLAELKTLQMRPRVDVTGKREFPDRPIDTKGAHITTLSELLSLQNGPGGFYIEIKCPVWHRKNGVDVTKIALAGLAKSHISPPRVWLQCFDPSELKRLHGELKSPYHQTQLIGQNSESLDPDGQKFNFDAMRTPDGLRAIKKYADAIGPRLNFVVSLFGVSSLVADAHTTGLQVHPYSLQTDRAPFQPPLTQNWIRAFERAKIEAIFTDQPDEVRALLSPPRKGTPSTK